MDSCDVESQALNIQQRSKRFAIRIVRFAVALPRSPVGIVFMRQVVRSGTSIGANVEEAQDALSRPDFIRTMQIALKEARETLYWIDVIIEVGLLSAERCVAIRQECDEIVRILRVIVRNTKER